MCTLNFYTIKKVKKFQLSNGYIQNIFWGAQKKSGEFSLNQGGSSQAQLFLYLFQTWEMTKQQEKDFEKCFRI